MATAIYVRISRDTDDTRLGVARQRDDCQALCEKNKWWSPATVYEDNDTSAYSGRRRPAYEQMLADMQAGVVDRVVAWHPDRLHRKLDELQRFIEIVDATRCAVVTVTAGDYDLSTVEGRMVARIIGSVAQAESEHKSRRIRRKHLELAQNGKLSGGGSRPFGYRRVTGADGKVRLEVDPAEAAVIVDVMGRLLAGESLISLVKDLTARRVPTASGGVWRLGTLRGILEGGLISGQREHHGELVAAGDWPPIVTVEDTRNARAIFKARSYGAGRARDTHLLSGLVRCGLCGGRMHGGDVVAGVPKLRCARLPIGCGKVVIVKADLCDLVAEAILAVTDHQAFADTAATLTRRRVDVGDDARNCEAQLAELAAAYADQIISMGEWRIARDRIEARLAAVTVTEGAAITAAAAILPFTRKPGTLRKAWPNLPLPQRRGIAAALIDHVTISPTLVRGRNRFDPDRVDIAWRV